MGSVGSSGKIKTSYEVNRETLDYGWKSEESKRLANEALDEMKTVINEIMSDRYFPTSEDFRDNPYKAYDWIYNILADTYPHTVSDDESRKLLRVTDNDVIFVEVGLGQTKDGKLRINLRPFIWSQDDFTKEELAEWGIEK